MNFGTKKTLIVRFGDWQAETAEQKGKYN